MAFARQAGGSIEPFRPAAPEHNVLGQDEGPTVPPGALVAQTKRNSIMEHAQQVCDYD